MRLKAKFFLPAFCFLILSTLAAAANAQIGIVDAGAKVKPKLVVLGSYRMALVRNNRLRPKFDDVTAPERQKQMAKLIEKLKRFKPTKIAVEVSSQNDAKVQQLYERYLSGNYQLSKNEIDQIGFRLAKELGHKKVYCVDWAEYPNDPSSSFETYASRDAELSGFLKIVYQNLRREVDAKHEKLFALPVIDQLALLNQPDRMAKEHRMFFELMRVGRGKEYAGANFLSSWYGRNMKILVNLVRITDSPNDRILVIYGYGHAKLMTQLAGESGFYDVENPLKYLKARK